MLKKISSLKPNGILALRRLFTTLKMGIYLDIIQHPNSEKYANQRFYVVDVRGYVYLVPFFC